MSAIVVERSIDLQHTAARLWPLVGDTERLNRAVGLGRLTVVPNEDDTAARYVVKTTSGGLPLTYKERPFEWIENESFTVRREVLEGLVGYVDNQFRLEPLASGTRVHLRLEVKSKYTLLKPIIGMQLSRVATKILGQFEVAAAELGPESTSGQQATAEKPGEKPRSSGPLERAEDELLAALSEDTEKALARRLVAHLREGEDIDVDRMRPFELADIWKTDRRETLAVFLRAVRVGLLDLSWDIVCPSCRTAATSVDGLADLGEEGHCQLCEIDFGVELDRAVEATFSPAPSIRQVDAGPYCIGGPLRTPHVVTQAILPANGSAQVKAPQEPGEFRLFVRGGATARVTVAIDAPQEAEVEVVDKTILPATLQLSPGGMVVVRQPGGEESHVKLERSTWKDQAATAHLVSMLPSFRRQFAGEVLKPGVSLRIGKVGLLFTDLTDSTQLYSHIGDAKAFRVVQDHFDLLFEVIADHKGTVVKTIGDAIMAAFAEDEAMIRCAIALHRAFPEFRRENPDSGRTRLKIGAYAGACYTVNANSNLDYFGQSVNIAARLQGAAMGGELVLTEQLAEVAEPLGWFGDAEVLEHFEASLKGVDGPVRAVRILADELPDAE